MPTGDSASSHAAAESFANRCSSLPMGRLGLAEEFAALACFLASVAGGYISGTAINLDRALNTVV
jgi:3-oxoacyl-[acyl-carrier protein] reductase